MARRISAALPELQEAAAVAAAEAEALGTNLAALHDSRFVGYNGTGPWGLPANAPLPPDAS